MPPTATQGENLRRLRDSPVCIICGRPGEAATIARALGIESQVFQGHEVAQVDSAHTFYYGEFDLASGEKLGYVLTSSTRQGIQSFTVHAALLFHILRPRFVIHAGVCAGFKDAQKMISLGDVVFGENAVNLEEGKFKKSDSGDIVFIPDYNIVSVRAGDMQAFADDGVRKHYHYGDFISGSAVRGDAQMIFTNIRQQMKRNSIAVDMEASAFLELCQHFFKDSACLGVVKGISDFGDEFKGDDPDVKKKALENTAVALQQWITTRISRIYWDPDYSKEPAAEIVPGYYDNFVRRVLDNVNQGLPVSKKIKHDEHPKALLQNQPSTVLDGKKMAGFKIVLPKDNQPRQYSTLGPISAVCKKYGIIEVEVGGDHGKRGLYHARGYLIDFPRTVNRYADTFDATYQVKVFGELLKKKEYFDSSSDSVKAMVCSWDEFIAWLEIPEALNGLEVEVTKLQNGDVDGNNNRLRSRPTATKSRSMSRLRGMFLRPKVAA